MTQDESELLSEPERDAVAFPLRVMGAGESRHRHLDDNPFEAFFRNPDQERFLRLLRDLVRQDIETDDIVESILVFSKKCQWVERGDWDMARGDQLWSFGRDFHFLERRLFHRVRRLQRTKQEVSPLKDEDLSEHFYKTNLGLWIFRKSRIDKYGFSDILEKIIRKCTCDSKETLWYKGVAFSKETLIDYMILASDQDNAPYNLTGLFTDVANHKLHPGTPELHLPTPTYPDSGHEAIRRDKSRVIIPQIWEYRESDCTLHEHDESAYEAFVRIATNAGKTQGINKDTHTKIHKAFCSILVELSISRMQTTVYIARHLLRHSTHCDCTVKDTAWRKGFSLLRWHYPEIKLWSYASTFVTERQPTALPLHKERPDLFTFGWAQTVWKLYHEKCHSVQKIVAYLISKCDRDSNTYVLFFRGNRFSEEKLVRFVLDMAGRARMPEALDTRPEVDYVGKHNWLRMTAEEFIKSKDLPKKPECLYCQGEDPIMNCTSCHVYAHGRDVKDGPYIKSCADSLDADNDENCKGHIFDSQSDRNDKASQYLEMDASSQATVPDPTSHTTAAAQDTVILQAQPVAPHGQELTKDAASAPDLKTILSTTFSIVIPSEESKLDQDIKLLTETVSKTFIHGNPQGISTALLSLLPKGFSNTPEMKKIATKATVNFLTNLEEETGKLAANLNSEIINKRKCLHYEILVSVVIELLSSAYEDKLVRDLADTNPAATWVAMPLNCIAYKVEVENLIEALHMWAKDLLMTNIVIEAPVSQDTALRLKNAVAHHRHNGIDDGPSHNHGNAWFIRSQDGKRRVPMPFNRRLTVIYIGLCLSRQTKTSQNMQECIRMLNGELFYKAYVPTTTDRLWRQAFSLSLKDSDGFIVNTTTSFSTLTKANARHFLDGSTIRALVALTDDFIKEGRARWTIQKEKDLGSVFHVPIQVTHDSDASQSLLNPITITSTLTAATLTSPTGPKSHQGSKAGQSTAMKGLGQGAGGTTALLPATTTMTSPTVLKSHQGSKPGQITTKKGLGQGTGGTPTLLASLPKPTPSSATPVGQSTHSSHTLHEKQGTSGQVATSDTIVSQASNSSSSSARRRQRASRLAGGKRMREQNNQETEHKSEEQGTAARHIEANLAAISTSSSAGSREQLTLEDIGESSAESVCSIGLDAPALSIEERMLLGLGTKFIGQDRSMVPTEPGIEANLQATAFETLLQRRLFFGDKEDAVYRKESWMPRSTFKPSATNAWDLLTDTQRLTALDVADAESNHLLRLFYGEQPPSSPLPEKLVKGLRSLTRRISNGEIIVTLCDKNLGFVALSRQTYVDAVLEHLSDRTTYEVIGPDTTQTRTAYKNSYLNELESLTARLGKESQRKLMVATRSTVKDTQVFKIIVKIHKMTGDFTKLKTRPITPAVGFYTSVLSRYISDFLVLALPLVRSYVRDATDAAQKLIQVKCGNTELTSITGDIPSMFTNVPMDRANVIIVIDYVLKLVQRNTPEALTTWPNRLFLVDAVLLVCKFNVITGPDGRLYLQTEGLAMGTSLAAAFASLAIAAREEMFLSIFGQNFLIWLRFADDIYALSDSDRTAILDSIKHFCSDVPKLNDVPWDIVSARKDAVFLDVRVSLCSSRIAGVNLMVTSLYQKKMNRYQYLPYYTCHPTHMVKSWVASETMRYARLCFHKHDFMEIINLFKARLKARGYPPHVIDDGISKIDYVSVQHETMHFAVKLSDCVLCEAQAATHPTPSVPPSYADPNRLARSGKVAKIREGGDVVEARRYLTLTAIQPLVEHRKDIARSLTRGLRRAERITGLAKSNIQIAWKTPKNLSSVFAGHNRKSLVQLK